MDKVTDQSLTKEFEDMRKNLKKAETKLNAREKIVRQIHIAQRSKLQTRKWVLLDSILYGFEPGDKIELFEPHDPTDPIIGTVKRRPGCSPGTYIEDVSEYVCIVIQREPTETNNDDEDYFLKSGWGQMIRLIKQSPKQEKIDEEEAKTAIEEVILD